MSRDNYTLKVKILLNRKYRGIAPISQIGAALKNLQLDDDGTMIEKVSVNYNPTKQEGGI